MFTPFAVAVACGLVFAATPLSAATFLGPSACSSSADIPLQFYAGGSPLFLDDFEDGTLDGGITASAGGVLTTGNLRDSDDAEDGVIDASGSQGNPYFSANAAAGILFTFATRIAAAAAVWTDGRGEVTFEAFRDGLLPGMIGPVAIAEANITGQTA
jgi:hypothetical protein